MTVQNPDSTYQVTSTVFPTTPRTEADAIAERALDAARPAPATAGDLLVSTRSLTVTDLERYADAPNAKRGTVTLVTGDSLARYVNRHREERGAQLYADVEARSIVAILNDHEARVEARPASHPGWRDHRAELHLRSTPSWVFWVDRDGELGNQVEFAHHLEDGRLDIVDPPAADLLELAQSFEATTRVEFKTAHRLQDGQRQLTYVEQTDASAGAGDRLTIPEAFTLRIAPFEGSDPVDLKAWLRYRINGGQLRIGYQLDRPEDAVRAAFTAVLAEVEKATELEALHGTAPVALR